ncbi:hypothetical protein BGW36DRAFT_346753 [Talaromyces proteolyticus]|uniref:Integral membrane protein n=1 Tax=Talaromyces proteolyticus TaxID=1131652 RepID=A0AAD4KJL7_9EURO|nr:uncharacterized protein BGW36DRAFT_346753 [Talaromyces proteolyticus]KAH8692771.1 hypothetical protein BGW36DRAFT_346753 [Talaromyces proteolyticus]
MRILSLPLFLRSGYGYIFISFTIIYLLLIRYCRTHYYQDPTSYFFDPERGYEPIYTRFRVSQSINYLHHVNETASRATNITAASINKNASLCVGIASIARNDIDYMESTVGSLLVDLTEQEREDMHLTLLIAHTDPSKHPFHSHKWLSAAADTVLTYDLPQKQIDYIKKLEMGKGRPKEKALFDYTYLLKACQDVGTPYVIIIEDDVVAMDGWYHRTVQALEDAARKTRDMGASRYLYLRLFYTQKFLGWNDEEWLAYFLGSLAVVASVGGVLMATLYVPYANRFLRKDIIVVLCLVCTPLCIVLFFAAGRVSMLPISAGVHQMPKFGCCTQAIAYPRERVPDVIDWYDSQQTGDADSLLERYANENKEIRWALTPSLFQHVGIRSSKFEDDGFRRDAKSIWNFQFESNDPMALQIEHEKAVEGLHN